MPMLPSLEKPTLNLAGFSHGINRVALSRDGRYTATSDVDMNVELWEAGQLRHARNFESISEKIRPLDRVRGLAFSPHGNHLYVAAGDHVTALRTDSWETEWDYVAPRSFGFLIISPVTLDVADNGDVAASFDNGSIVIWDGAGIRKNLVRDNDSPRWLRFTNGGARIVGSDSFSLCVWNLNSRERKFKLRLQDRVYTIDADPAGTVIAARTLQSIMLYDLVERQTMSVIPVGPGAPVVAVHPEQRIVAFAEKNRITLADFEGKPVDQFEVAVSSALSMCFTPSGEELLVGCTEKKLIRRGLVG